MVRIFNLDSPLENVRPWIQFGRYLSMASADQKQSYENAKRLTAVGDIVGAQGAWREVVTQQPELQEAHVNICVCSLKLGEWDYALRVLIETELRFPSDARLPAWRAQALVNLGRRLGARDAYIRALKLDPSDRISRKGLTTLGFDPDAKLGGSDAFAIPDRRFPDETISELIELCRRPSYSETSDEYWQVRNSHRILSQFSWDLYGAEAMRHYARTFDVTRSAPLYETGLVVGKLPEGALENIRAAFDACEVTHFEGDDTTEGYYCDPQMAQADMRNRTSRFFRVSEELNEAIGDWLHTVRDDLSHAMGHDWGVRQVWAHSMREREKVDPGDALSAIEWHTDGAPLAMKKIMIYLNGASSELGTTDFELRTEEKVRISGPPGIWGLFENSAIKHRAVVPRVAPRPVVELLIVPAFSTDTFPESHTINCGFPWFPWPSKVDDTDAVLAEDFRREVLERRINKRIIGLARAIPGNEDISLDVDIFQARIKDR
jgi:tetratricopeptide (TPR) repeat protein